MKKFYLTLLFIYAALYSHAIEPVFQTYANGSIMYAFNYNANRTGIIVEVRDANDANAPWTQLSGTFTKNWNSGSLYAHWTFTTNFSNRLAARIAETTSEGQGEFHDVDDIISTFSTKGTLLTSDSSRGPAAFDGKLNVVDTTYTGYDFGSIKRISKIRYIFRFDVGIFRWESRWVNSTFQTASDSSFSDATTIATITKDGYSIDHMNEITFEPPLETRYIRHYAKSGFSSLSECEFISPDMQYQFPAPKIDDYTFHQTNLVLSWSIPAMYAQLSNVVERARSADGPWTEVSRVFLPGETMCYTDLTAKVGLKYYYRVRAYCGHINYYGHEMISQIASRYRMRCLERDLSNPTQLYENVVILREPGDSNDTYAKKKYAFDGNPNNSNVAGNFPDINVNGGKVHLGLDFPSPCYLGAVWYSGRINILDRVNYVKVFGSNDSTAPTEAPTTLTGAFLCNSTTGTGVTYALNPEKQSYRYLYAWKENSAWYGNIAEMCFFGWTIQDIIATGEPFAPQDISALNTDEKGSVEVAWGDGANITSYDITYRVEGEEEWATAQTGISTEAHSHTIHGLETGKWYEIRLVGHGEEYDVFSPTCKVYVYQLIPGNGTGIRAILYGAQDELHISTEPTIETHLYEKAEIDQESGTLFTSASHQKAWVFMHGKLIVPLDGNYTFKIDTQGSDGFTFHLDDSVRIPYGSSSRIHTITLSLTAGEHKLYIGYDSKNVHKFLRFSWALENVWAFKTVPTSQLIPASDEDIAAYLPASFEGFRCSFPTLCTTCVPHAKHIGPGKFEIKGNNSDFQSTGVLTALTKLVRGPFVFDIDVTASGGRTGIFVSDENGAFENTLVYIFTGTSRGLKGKKGDLLSPAWSDVPYQCQRLERKEDKTINFYMKRRDSETWTLLHTIPNGKWPEKGIDLSGRKLRIGVHNFLNSGTPAVIQNIQLKLLSPGMVIRLR